MNKDITKYKSRVDAGLILAKIVQESSFAAPYVLAIPRGGVEVAAPIAERLGVPLNTIIVKKVSYPSSPETALGAISSDGTTVFSEEAHKEYSIEKLDSFSRSVYDEIKRRESLYGSFEPGEVIDKDVLIVDDGIATGSSIVAAVKSVKNYGPASVNIVVPVSSKFAYDMLNVEVDSIICPVISDAMFFAVGMFYDNWYDLSDQEIISLIRKHS